MSDLHPAWIVAGMLVLFICVGGYVYANTVNCPEVCTYVERQFEPAHTKVWYSYHCMSHDKNGFCTFSIPIEHRDEIPDRWFITWLKVCGEIHVEQVSQERFDNPPSQQNHVHRRWRHCRRAVR